MAFTCTISGRCRAVADVGLVGDAEDVVWVCEVAGYRGEAGRSCEERVGCCVFEEERGSGRSNGILVGDSRK
jgi:hypothetical protein